MTFRPRPNRTPKTLQRGGLPLGMQIYSGDLSFIETPGYTGVDFYTLDMEHSRVDVEMMEQCIRAADAASLTRWSGSQGDSR